MKKSMLVAMALVLAPGPCLASGLLVQLSKVGGTARSESGVVHLRVVNTGNRAVYIFKYKTPFFSANGRLPNSQFVMRSEGGEKVEYTGLNENHVVTPAGFVQLMPGQSLEKDVDLSRDYDLKGGRYSVQYVQRMVSYENPATLPRNAELHVPAGVRSNLLDIWVNSSLVGAAKARRL